MSQLDELKKYTTVVADTGDIESIKKFAPQDATTNPSLVLKAAQLPQYQPLIADAIGKARRQGGSAETQLINACDQVAVDIGSEVLRHVPGVSPPKWMLALPGIAGCASRRRASSSSYMKKWHWSRADSN